MWKLDLSIGIPNSFTLPQTCPTCHQPMQSNINISEQVHIESTVLEEISSCLNRSSLEQKNLLTIEDRAKKANSSKMSRLGDINALQDNANKKRCSWDDKIQFVQRRLQGAKRDQQAAALNFNQAAKQLDVKSKLASLRARLNNAIEKFEQNANSLNITRMELDGCERQLSEFNLERLSNIEVARVMSDICDKFGPKGIQTYVMAGAVSTLEFTTQILLDELSDGTQRIELTLDSGDCIARKAYIRGENGVFKERALASLSGGQWRRCSIAFTLAFASLVANRANFRPSLLVLDEPLTHLDQSGRSNVGRLIRKLLCRESEHLHDGSMTDSPSFLGFHLSTILIILQDLAAEELEESFDAIDEVSKEYGYSTVIVDN
jgi:DNA repair exonuclease SbcCD ATPase subunit